VACSPVAGYPAVAVATMVALFCILVYVPSYVNTVLKLRSGAIPSLHDPYFVKLREQADNIVQNIGTCLRCLPPFLDISIAHLVAYLSGNMVFSVMGAGVFTGFLVFSLIFAFAYPQTRDVALTYLAMAIGIVSVVFQTAWFPILRLTSTDMMFYFQISTIIIKIVGMKLLRQRHFSSFYRKRARGANYTNIFFECWYIGTGLLVVIARRKFAAGCVMRSSNKCHAI
jgi:hypothetical protein